MLKRHEVLFNQLEGFREGTIHAIDGITEEMADLIPTGFNNNIRWNLGHIFIDQYLWIEHLTKEPISLPDGYRDRFAYGTSPSSWTSRPPSINELREQLSQQPARIKELYAERLEEEFPPTELGMHTIAQVLVRTIFHEGLHIAAIQNIRRFV